MDNKNIDKRFSPLSWEYEWWKSEHPNSKLTEEEYIENFLNIISRIPKIDKFEF